MLLGKHVKELRTYADSSGVVWFADGKGKAKSSNLRADAFAADELCTKAEKVRLLGLPCNAGLIIELGRVLQAAGCLEKLEIGTPLFCRTLYQTEPGEVLEGMDRLDGLNACLGGWHKATGHDMTVYALVNSVFYGTDREGLLEKHPAYAAVSFLQQYSRVDMEMLLAHIVDPRWYVDLARPGRTAKLRSYLGLRTPIVSKVWHRDVSVLEQYGQASSRTWNLIDAWTDSKREAPAYPELDLPGNLVWRRYLEIDDPIRGTLRASSWFVLFLREVWLDAMSPQELFVPEYFFVRKGMDVANVDQDGTVAQAYRSHCEELRNRA
jgi:hypothetical protein